MAVADNRQRFMPLPDDRLPGRGEELVPPEAVLLVHPVEPEFTGEVPFFLLERPNVLTTLEYKKLHSC